MKLTRIMTISTATLALLLGGCSNFNPNNGAPVVHNTTQQTVDPYAGFDEDVSALDGQKAEKLLKEYRVEKKDVSREGLVINIGD